MVRMENRGDIDKAGKQRETSKLSWFFPFLVKK